MRSENVDLTQSLSKNRDTKNARVAPIVEANEANNNPKPKPNKAPAPKVKIMAPGKLRAVAVT